MFPCVINNGCNGFIFVVSVSCLFDDNDVEFIIEKFRIWSSILDFVSSVCVKASANLLELGIVNLLFIESDDDDDDDDDDEAVNEDDGPINGFVKIGVVIVVFLIAADNILPFIIKIYY